MIARLFCKTGALAGSEFRIDEEAVIGRGEQNDISLRSEAVAGEHARIFFDDESDCYVLEDLDSSNGTWLDDAKVNHPVRMRDLHVITFAGTLDFIFHVVEEVPASAASEASKTRFGEAPGVSSLPSEGDASEAEQTQFGEAPGGLSDLSDLDPPDDDDPDDSSEEEADVDKTRFGEAPGDLPDRSGETASSQTGSDSPEDDDEATIGRTQFGDLPGAPPDVSDDAPSADTEGPPPDEDDESEVEHTQFGEASGALPDDFDEEPSSEPGEDSSEDEAEAARTQFGDPPGAPPDPSAEEHTSDGEDPVEDADPSGPDSSLSEHSESFDDETSEGERTQFGAAPDALPDLPTDDRPSTHEADGPDREGPPAEEGVPASETATPYVLHLTPLEGDEETHPLPTGTVTVGRSPDCDIHIDDPGVSRRHAELIVDEDEVVLKDMESKNFTFLDGERLTEPVTLSPGTEIKFGLQLKAELRHIDR